MGRGKAFSALKAWDVFRMLEQFKKDFVFKLGMCAALDGVQGLRQVWRNGFGSNTIKRGRLTTSLPLPPTQAIFLKSRMSFSINHP